MKRHSCKLTQCFRHAYTCKGCNRIVSTAQSTHIPRTCVLLNEPKEQGRSCYKSPGHEGSPNLQWPADISMLVNLENQR